MARAWDTFHKWRRLKKNTTGTPTRFTSLKQHLKAVDDGQRIATTLKGEISAKIATVHIRHYRRVEVDRCSRLRFPSHALRWGLLREAGIIRLTKCTVLQMCCFQMFCGIVDGCRTAAVLLFDLRSTRGAIRKLRAAASQRQPVHSICHTEDDHLLCATMGGVWAWGAGTNTEGGSTGVKNGDEEGQTAERLQIQVNAGYVPRSFETLLQGSVSLSRSTRQHRHQDALCHFPMNLGPRDFTCQGCLNSRSARQSGHMRTNQALKIKNNLLRSNRQGSHWNPFRCRFVRNCQVF